MAEDRAGRRLQQKLAERDKTDYSSGLKNAMSTKEGRRFLWILCTNAGLNIDSYATEPTTMAYSVGRKSVAEGLIREIQEAQPDLYLTMMKEVNDEHAYRTQLAADALERSDRNGEWNSDGDAGDDDTAG